MLRNLLAQPEVHTNLGPASVPIHFTLHSTRPGYSPTMKAIEERLLADVYGIPHLAVASSQSEADCKRLFHVVIDFCYGVVRFSFATVSEGGQCLLCGFSIPSFELAAIFDEISIIAMIFLTLSSLLVPLLVYFNMLLSFHQ